MPFWEGLKIGLAMVLFIGPVFFTLLKASLDHGFKGGFTVALGIIFSDIVAIVICSLGAISFFKNEGNQVYISIAAGLILLFLGLKYIFKPKLYSKDSVALGTKDFVGLFGSGFLVNFVNPFVFIVWIAILVYGKGLYEMKESLWLYIIGVLIGIFATDTLKAYFAQKLSRFTNPVILTRIYYVIGIVMVLFSLRTFYHAYGLV